MKIGASTACFYPLETEKALMEIINAGFKETEIFFNAKSEIEDDFVMDLKKCADNNGVNVVSVHPFSTFMESGCLFSQYERRMDWVLDLYEKQCEAAMKLGAKVLVIHGMRIKRADIPDEMYFERFSKLIEIGKKYGVSVCQENVLDFKSQNIDFCKKMRMALGNDFKMVFDVKQAVIANENPLEFVNEFKNEIIHLHLSDNNNEKSCLPPGMGNFDFKEIKEILDKTTNPTYVIEIYSKGFDVKKELIQSRKYLERI